MEAGANLFEDLVMFRVTARLLLRVDQLVAEDHLENPTPGRREYDLVEAMFELFQ